jgi:single-strand DNA-binding protein
MSRSLNKVQLIGNLGADPEIRTTPNGAKVAQFSLATTRQWTSASGERQEKTEWHKCVAWNGSKGTGLADVLARYASKGDKLFVEGQLEYRQYEKDGDTRYVTEINVREILLLGARQVDGASSAPPSREQASARAASRSPAHATAAPKRAAQTEFTDFPEAMDGDDDLPF